MGNNIGLSFVGQVSANSNKTLSSRSLDFAYRVAKISVAFPIGSARLVRAHVIVSPDPTIPVAGMPSGQSVLGQYTSTDYLVGDGEIKEVECGFDVLSKGSWLKVYVVNSDSIIHSVDAQITLERLES